MSDRRFNGVYGQIRFTFANYSVDAEPETIGPEERQLYVKETWTVEGWIYAANVQNFKGYWAQVERELWTPRQAFRIYLDAGDTGSAYDLVNVRRQDDLNDGPRPRNVKVRQFSGGICARITFVVELARPRQSSNTKFAVTTFGETIEITDRYTSIRTISGTVRMDPLHAYDCRQDVESRFPRLAGFRRTRSWKRSRDGGEIDFDLKDTEEFYPLPQPFTAGQATFGLRLTTDDEGKEKWSKALSAWYEPPDTDDACTAKKSTAELLLLLAASRFGQTGEMVKLLELKEDIWTGRVTLDYLSEGEGRATYSSQYKTYFGSAIPDAGGDEYDAGPAGFLAIPFRDSSWSDSGFTTSGEVQNPPAKRDARFGAGRAPDGLVPMGRSSASNVPISIEVRWDFRQKYHNVVLGVKKKDAANIIQETTNPERTVVIFGRAVFQESIPDELPGTKFLGSIVNAGAPLSKRSIPSKPFQDAAGSWFFPVEWIIKCAISKNLDMLTLAQSTANSYKTEAQAK